MARSLEEIDADIAKVKAEMALRNKYTQGFNQPQTKVGWASYIINNDRGLLDQYQTREDVWKKQIEQQLYQAEQNRLQRDNAKEIAGMSKSSGSTSADKLEQFAKFNREREIAEADYEAALENLDPNDEISKANVKKMAAKLNYLYSLQPELNYDAVNPDYNKPGKSVEIKRNKSALDALINKNVWDDPDRDEAYRLLYTLPEEMQPDYVTKIANHKGTTGDQARKDAAIIRDFNNMTSGEQAKYIADNPNTAKRLNLQQRKSK